MSVLKSLQQSASHLDKLDMQLGLEVKNRASGNVGLYIEMSCDKLLGATNS